MFIRMVECILRQGKGTREIDDKKSSWKSVAKRKIKLQNQINCLIKFARREKSPD